MSEPRTKAGRALVAWSESDADLLDKHGFRTVREAVSAIEIEALPTVDELEKAMHGLPTGTVRLQAKTLLHRLGGKVDDLWSSE